MPDIKVTDKVSDKIDEYQTIASAANGMFDDFMARVPYFIVAIIVLLLFWLLSSIFKSLVTKLLSKSHTHRNLVRVFQRIGGALILFVGFMIGAASRPAATGPNPDEEAATTRGGGGLIIIPGGLGGGSSNSGGSSGRTGYSSGGSHK